MGGQNGLRPPLAPQGQRFNEEEIGVETGLRWPGKQRTDAQLGEGEVQIGQFAYADAWHEAARTLLRDWFDALRELHSAKVLQAQAELAQAQLSAIERRVQAGEAAKLDTLAAQAEAARIQAQAVRTRAQAQLLQQALQRQYPGLPLPSDAGLEEAALDGTDIAVADWAQKILADNHELELAQARAAQARLQARRAEQERTGDPTVGVRARRERSGEERIWGAYLSIPLGSAGRRADAEAAAAQAEMAQQEYERTRQRVSTDAWRAASEAQQTRTTWQQLRHAWQQIAQSAQLQARAYELGESPLADLLLARRNALEAQLAADAAALDAMQAQARLLLDRTIFGLRPKKVRIEAMNRCARTKTRHSLMFFRHNGRLFLIFPSQTSLEKTRPCHTNPSAASWPTWRSATPANPNSCKPSPRSWKACGRSSARTRVMPSTACSNVWSSPNAW